MLHHTYHTALDMLPPVRHIVSLSSGASSAVAAQRVIERHGKHNTELVFTDTRWEDDDNYRFLRDLSNFWQMPIVTLTDGRTPLDVAQQERIIPNQKIAPCTRELKIKPFADYLRGLQTAGYRPVVYLGMSWNERHRTIAPRRNYGAIGVWTEYPLLWPEMCADPLAEVRAWGIEPPRMYKQGYKHANCGGRCVKQGKRDWKRTLTYYPDRYAETAAWERMMRQEETFSQYGFLRHQEGGETRAMTLDELRAEIESYADKNPTLWDFIADASGCTLECGAGDPGELKAAA